jgi:hypothetical protein
MTYPENVLDEDVLRLKHLRESPDFHHESVSVVKPSCVVI